MRFSLMEILILGLVGAFAAALVAVLVYVVVHTFGGARRRE